MNCVAPERHLGCHDTCSKYLDERAEWDRCRETARKERDITIYFADQIRKGRNYFKRSSSRVKVER